MTKAIRLEKAGGPEVLDFKDIELPPPPPGQVQVRHSAIGVNFIDIYHRTGLYPVPLPGGLGSEAAGVVDALGEGVTRVKIGERVGYAAGVIGAYAEAANVPADKLVRLPDGISDEVAAAIGHCNTHRHTDLVGVAQRSLQSVFGTRERDARPVRNVRHRSRPAVIAHRSAG